MIRCGRACGAALAAVVALSLAGGCDGTESSRTLPAPATTAPSTTTTTTVPTDSATTAATTTTEPAVSTQPAASLMNINGHLTVFPAARLRLESDGRNVIALLYSDDPREALKSNYTGNSFYLRMALDIEDPEKLHDATWKYAAPSGSEREADSPYGIFLGGRKIALQPFQTSARFKVDEKGETLVQLGGQFRVLDDTPGKGPAQVLPLSAELAVQVDKER